MAVSSSPWGPFTDTGGPIVEHSWNCVACYIDPSYFRDPETGKHYLLWKGDTLVQATLLQPWYLLTRHKLQLPISPSVIYIQELDEEGVAFKEGSEPESILWTDRCSWPASCCSVARLCVRISEKLIVEGPWLMHRASRYYLFYSSSWVTSPSYKVEVAVADSVTGHYVKGDTPVIQA